MRKTRQPGTVKVMVPGGMLGYGYDYDILRAALDQHPDVIAQDAGSIDPGPYYLGAGESFVPRLSAKMDLEPMLVGARRLNIPLILTTAGGSGGHPHLLWMRDIVLEIAREHQLSFRLALVDAEVDTEYLANRVAREELKGLHHNRPLKVEDVRRSSHIVGQMGVEPVVAALEQDADVILAGRASDEVSIAALPIAMGMGWGIALHMGKVLECGSRTIERARGARTPVFGLCRKDSFQIFPADPDSRATIDSITTHMLYEERDPLLIEGPGGTMDATACEFTQVEPRLVEVRGSRYVTHPYQVKLEGAARVGYRTIIVGGSRSTALHEKLDQYLAAVRAKVEKQFAALPRDSWQLYFHCYGRDAVMGEREPERDRVPHEIGVAGEVVAPTQELADTLCHYAIGTVLHHLDFPGNLSEGGGNMAFLTSPLETGRGEVYEFSVFHLLPLEDPLEIFPITIERVEKGVVR